MAGPLDMHMPALEYLTLSWSVLLTELKLFYNYYYKFLVGSSLGVVERFLFQARLLPMIYLFSFSFVRSLSQLSQDFGGYSSARYCVSSVEFAILSD